MSYSEPELKSDGIVAVCDAHLTLEPSEKHRSFAIVVPPKEAQFWIDNFNYYLQRKFKPRLAALYVECMRLGTFRENTTISFAVLDGRPILVNGQHTLSAVSTFGKSVLLQVELRRVYSDSEVDQLYSTFDIGGLRTTLDAIGGMDAELGLKKEEAGKLSAAVKLITLGLKTRNGRVSVKLERDIKDHEFVKAAMRSWKAEANSYFDAIRSASRLDRNMFMRADVVATALVSYRFQPDVASKFWGIAANDDGLRKFDPRKTLGSWLRENSTTGTKVNDQHKACIACWNAFFTNRELAKVFTATTSATRLMGCSSFYVDQTDEA